MERAEILGELIKEVLGPRNGINEVLLEEHDPKNEYIVGVLAPKESQNGRDIDAEADLISESDSDDEDSAGGDVGIATGLAPALDPKSLPRSLGLSFVVQGEGNPILEVCSTWARYVGLGESWHRKPNYDFERVAVSTNGHTWTSKSDLGVEFTLRSILIRPSVYRVSIFLVNGTQIVNGEKVTSQDCIFQPEIRVNCVQGCKLLPIENHDSFDESADPEESSLRMLYDERPAFARGHLVGVTWKDIDPQRPPVSSELPKIPPFFWGDSEVLPEEVRRKFVVCDVRTDYTPTYPVEAPDMRWREEYSVQPQLDPEKLAECWSPSDIREALNPLVEGYSKWLCEQRELKKDLHPKFHDVAERHFNDIERRSIGRIKRSIDMLCEDIDVRMAFCFANKVMALQSEWANKGTHNSWRPFQIAFILQNLASVADEGDSERETADLLWFATGGGKTESYLGLAVFTIALQRRRAEVDFGGHKKGAGVNVLSRYTLRLLTIQQFRRTLRVITAAEYLRVAGVNVLGSKIGWRPKGCHITDDFVWGSERFSLGLWVGGGVTPNGLHSFDFRDQNGRIRHVPGAIELLTKGSNKAYGEPAQVITCPCCDSYVAIPNEGLSSGKHVLHFLFKGSNVKALFKDDIDIQDAVVVSEPTLTSLSSNVFTLSLGLSISSGKKVKPETIDSLWNDILSYQLGDNIQLLAASPVRLGYFIRTYTNRLGNDGEYGFDIVCPNPYCELNNTFWTEKVPVSVGSSRATAVDMEYQEVFEPFRLGNDPQISSRVVIPAYTVDDQIYHRCPSMIIATVDKFAQLASEPKAASMFGNVEYYHARWGYYRENCPPSDGSNLPTSIKSHPGEKRLRKGVQKFNPPSLIIQDELHLIEGALGSLFGLYETLIDELCTKYVDNRPIPPKYIVSTATVRQANKQIRSLFSRDYVQFPAMGISVNDNFFSKTSETHPIDSANAGRLYVGICAPGRGAQTPLIRIWSSLLQSVQVLRDNGVLEEQIDGFWTVVGYFNAIRELAGASALYRQDIPERIQYINQGNYREISDDPLELSGRSDSMELPGLLEQLSTTLMEGSSKDGVLTTSMFGTGVDVDRLRLMIINGQPKSTSSYIQASGRVGRKSGGLVVSFYRASRPRDLDHYEFFTGYHRALYKHVEPVTVAPFSPRAREKGLGPLSVAMLRQAFQLLDVDVSDSWRYQQKLQNQLYASAACNILQNRTSAEVRSILSIFEKRAERQPEGRKPDVTSVISELDAQLDKWYELAGRDQGLLYNESSMYRDPQYSVVLGDLQHYFRQLNIAFENSPQSLRTVEGTTTFKG